MRRGGGAAIDLTAVFRSELYADLAVLFRGNNDTDTKRQRPVIEDTAFPGPSGGVCGKNKTRRGP